MCRLTGMRMATFHWEMCGKGHHSYFILKRFGVTFVTRLLTRGVNNATPGSSRTHCFVRDSHLITETLIVMKTSVFRDIATCSPLKVDRRFRGTSVDFQRTKRHYIPEDRTCYFLRLFSVSICGRFLCVS